MNKYSAIKEYSINYMDPDEMNYFMVQFIMCDEQKIS